MAATKKHETTFTDARGRVWHVEFDDDAIHRLALAGLDIFAVMKMKLYDETQGFDPEVIIQRIHCLWALLAPQAKAAGVTAADFTEAIDPRPEPGNTKAHFAAWRAVLQAMVNRSPNPSEIDGLMLADDSNKAEGDCHSDARLGQGATAGKGVAGERTC